MKFYKIKFIDVDLAELVKFLYEVSEYDIYNCLEVDDNLYIINKEAFDKEIKFYDNLKYEKEDYEIS